MATLPKITGVITLASAGFTVARLEGGDTATYNVSLTDGDWFVAGDDQTGDLIKEIEDKVKAVGGGTPFANFECRLNTVTSIGQVDMVLAAGESATLTWGGHTGATDVRDWLRFSGATTGLSQVAALGTRVHKTGFYPTYVTIEDLRHFPDLSTQSRSDSGVVNTVSYTSLTEHRLTVHADGNPQAGAFNEYHDLRWLVVNHLQQGKRFRYYRDRTVTAAYVEVTTPTGFFTLVPILPLPFDPVNNQMSEGWYQHWEYDIDAFEYVS